MAKVVPLRCGGASGLVSRLELFMQIEKMLMFILRTLNGRKISHGAESQAAFH